MQGALVPHDPGGPAPSNNVGLGTFVLYLCPLEYMYTISFLQAVFSYTYPSNVPSEVRLSCNADNISLLNAETCLFYRYDRLEWIKYVWALGLLAAGQSSTMTVCVGV